MSPMPARELAEGQVLRGVCRSADADLLELRHPALTDLGAGDRGGRHPGLELRVERAADRALHDRGNHSHVLEDDLDVHQGDGRRVGTHGSRRRHGHGAGDARDPVLRPLHRRGPRGLHIGTRGVTPHESEGEERSCCRRCPRARAAKHHPTDPAGLPVDPCAACLGPNPVARRALHNPANNLFWKADEERLGVQVKLYEGPDWPLWTAAPDRDDGFLKATVLEVARSVTAGEPTWAPWIPGRGWHRRRPSCRRVPTGRQPRPDSEPSSSI